jgi:hypothetical protein
MHAFAPRISHRLLEALVRLDDRSVPIAETNRRLGAEAARLGLHRPSYQRIRELVHEIRGVKRGAIRLHVLLEIKLRSAGAGGVARERFRRPRARSRLATGFLVALCYLGGFARELARPP